MLHCFDKTITKEQLWYYAETWVYPMFHWYCVYEFTMKKQSNQFFPVKRKYSRQTNKCNLKLLLNKYCIIIQVEQLASIVAEKIMVMSAKPKNPEPVAAQKTEKQDDPLMNQLLEQLGLDSGDPADLATKLVLKELGLVPEDKKPKETDYIRSQSVSSIQPAWMKNDKPDPVVPRLKSVVVQPTPEKVFSKDSFIEPKVEERKEPEIPKSKSETIEEENLAAMNKILESVGVSDEASLAKLVAAAIGDDIQAEQMNTDSSYKPVIHDGDDDEAALNQPSVTQPIVSLFYINCKGNEIIFFI